MRCSKRNSWKSRTSSTSDPVAPAAGRGVSTRFILFLSPCCQACVLAAGPVYPVAICRSYSFGPVDQTTAQRSEESRLGKEGASTGKSRLSPVLAQHKPRQLSQYRQK